MANAHLVYDFTQTASSWRNWASPGLVLPAVSMGLILFPNAAQWLQQAGSPNGKAIWKLWAIRAFGVVSLCFSLLWSATSFSSLNGEYQQLVEARNHHQSSFTEGCLSAFHEMPEAGHDNERIAVGGHVFTYSDYLMTPSFNRTVSHGGPIQPDAWVRLEYVGNDIMSVMISEHACPSARRN